MSIYIIIGLLVIIAYWVGQKSGETNAENNDPDRDPALTDDQRTRLLFSKSVRYRLGRALILDNKEEASQAKKDLETLKANLLDSEIRSNIAKVEAKQNRTMAENEK